MNALAQKCAFAEPAFSTAC